MPGTFRVDEGMVTVDGLAMDNNAFNSMVAALYRFDVKSNIPDVNERAPDANPRFFVPTYALALIADGPEADYIWKAATQYFRPLLLGTPGLDVQGHPEKRTEYTFKNPTYSCQVATQWDIVDGLPVDTWPTFCKFSMWRQMPSLMCNNPFVQFATDGYFYIPIVTTVQNFLWQ